MCIQDEGESEEEEDAEEWSKPEVPPHKIKLPTQLPLETKRFSKYIR